MTQEADTPQGTRSPRQLELVPDTESASLRRTGWIGSGLGLRLAVFVERAVMAPDIPKIDPDRHPDPGASAWYFRDKVQHRIFHGQ